jgi:hypothetical protein
MDRRMIGLMCTYTDGQIELIPIAVQKNEHTGIQTGRQRGRKTDGLSDR